MLTITALTDSSGLHINLTAPTKTVRQYTRRDDPEISGPELEVMCNIVRKTPGVLGERMLGGGDKGASGALVLSEIVGDFKQAIAEEFSKLAPDYTDKYAAHTCKKWMEFNFCTLEKIDTLGI